MTDGTKIYKLNFELVPEECWWSNLRSNLSKADWDKVRFSAYKEADGKCRICGKRTAHLEAHEKWSYDEKRKIQKLEDVVAVCRDCHQVIHIGRTYLFGKGDDAMEHFMKVNGCTQSEFHLALGKANEENARRNEIEGWTADCSLLKKYGVAFPSFFRG